VTKRSYLIGGVAAAALAAGATQATAHQATVTCNPTGGYVVTPVRGSDLLEMVARVWRNERAAAPSLAERAP
jgi:hypothetical protein